MSEFRLPRWQRGVAIVDPKTGFPTIEGQRWQQSTVEKIEAQETLQDSALADIQALQTEQTAMLVDIQTALANAGIALTTATTALANANAIMPDIAPVTITADYTGTVLDGQLPRNIAATRFNDETDVTTSSAWSATTISGDADYTIGAATGVLNLTDITTTTVVEITSVRDGITRSRRVTITKALQEPPVSSGSLESAYDSSISPTTTASYSAANAGPLTLACGASGTVELAAPLSFVAAAAGIYAAYGKWQVSPAGAGTWADVDTEIRSPVPTFGQGTNEGSLTVNQSAPGLTPSSDYDFQLLLRNDTGTDTLYYAGTATATTE